jgi:DNA-binding NarL/FixJ family response regulator
MSADYWPEDLERARREGANGFISKRAGPLEWKAAIEKVHAGEFYWPEVAAGRSFDDVATEVLSPEEFKEYLLLRVGLRTKEIAAKLGKNEHTVRHCRDQISHKKQLWELEENLRKRGL